MPGSFAHPPKEYQGQGEEGRSGVGKGFPTLLPGSTTASPPAEQTAGGEDLDQIPGKGLSGAPRRQSAVSVLAISPGRQQMDSEFRAHTQGHTDKGRTRV